jgi:hypothetical protein
MSDIHKIKINDNMVDVKELAGKDGEGHPLYYVKTKGGLHCLFKSVDGKVSTIATAPHSAVLAFIAERQDPKIEWSYPLTKSEDPDEQDFDKLREAVFAPQTDELNKSEYLDSYLVYDVLDQSIDVTSKIFIKEKILQKQLSKYAIVRSLTLMDSPSVVCLHPDFVEYFNGR